MLAAALGVEVGEILQNEERIAVLTVGGVDVHLHRRTELVVALGIVGNGERVSARQRHMLTRPGHCFEGLAGGPVTHTEAEGGIAGRAVARLVEGDPLVGERVVDLDLLLQHFLAVFQDDQLAGEFLGPLASLRRS